MVEKRFVTAALGLAVVLASGAGLYLFLVGDGPITGVESRGGGLSVIVVSGPPDGANVSEFSGPITERPEVVATVNEAVNESTTDPGTPTNDSRIIAEAWTEISPGEEGEITEILEKYPFTNTEPVDSPYPRGYYFDYRNSTVVIVFEIYA